MSHVISFPWARTLRPLGNDPRVEWLFRALDGHPNIAKKRLIVQARSPEVDSSTTERPKS